MLVDAAMLAAAAVTSELILAARGSSSPGWSVAFGCLALALFWANGVYTPRLVSEIFRDLRLLFGQTVLAAMAIIVLGVLVAGSSDIAEQSIWAWGLALVYLVPARVLLSTIDARANRRGEGRPALVLGAGAVGNLAAKRLLNHSEFGLRPVGFIDEPRQTDADDPLPVPILGASPDLERISREHRIEVLVVAFSDADDEVLVRTVRQAQALGIRVTVVPRLFEVVTARVGVEHLGGLPLILLDGVDARSWRFKAKYCIDRVVAAVALLFILPLLLATAAAVWICMGRPILFRQERVGYEGRRFEITKFRTMTLAPPTAVADPDEDCVEAVGRVTRLGSFLRQTSIDELPQLLNVVRGEMSLVGPRPERPEFVELFRRRVYRYHDRHRVKVGITGWAQVNGLGRGADRFGSTSLAERVEWDNYYIENWSPSLDLKIVLMTMRALLRFRQA
jgi:exopolysaccharide biosynthesis polyprenyl glycosylphosphotransferase